jgi:gas vesicle protein
MRAETEPRTVARRLPELEPEDEVEVGRYWRAIVARWWLVAAAVALGVLVGYLLARGGGEVYEARATIYLGQPLSPSGNAQIQSLATNPATVSEIVRRHPLADRVQVATSTTSTGPAARQGINPLVVISVRGDARRETGQAAATLAEDVVTQVSGYVDEKIRALEDRLEGQNRELASIERRLDDLSAQVAGGRGLSSVERLTLMTLAGFSEQRRGQLLEERTDTQQLLTLARNVERSQVVGTSGAREVSARSPRSSMLVGGLIGLLAGAILALLWEPLVVRRRPRPA